MVGNHENPSDIKRNICPRLVVENFAIQSMQRKQLKKLVRILVFCARHSCEYVSCFQSIVDRLGRVRYIGRNSGEKPLQSNELWFYEYRTYFCLIRSTTALRYCCIMSHVMCSHEETEKEEGKGKNLS